MNRNDIIKFLKILIKTQQKEGKIMKFKKSIVLLALCSILVTGCSSKEPSKDLNKTQDIENPTKVESVTDENTITDDTQVNAQTSEIHFIDTGNSDAILIKQGDKSALIDAGDNDDEQRVVKYLKSQGITELEYIFATHPHADHIGGLDAVVDNIKVKHAYVSNGDADTKTYRDFINSMANKGLNPSVPLLNSEISLGSSKFKVLSVANENDPNNNSIVLEYINGNDKVLLMGDAEKEIESTINVGDVDLLKLGHHGSHSSSTPSFIDKVNPEYAVITVGSNNKYGHPHKETMDTLKERSNIEIHRNDECGDIVFISTGNGLEVDCKVGSYTSGKEEVKNIDKTPIETKKQEIEETYVEPTIEPSADIVYFTPNGKSYHSTSSCSTLSRSKVINSGSIEESGKFDPCDRCN